MQEADMRDQIRNGRYEPVLEYPKKPSKPILNLKHTSEEASAYAGLLKRWEHDMELWKERVSEYRASVNRLRTHSNAMLSNTVDSKDTRKQIEHFQWPKINQEEMADLLS